MAAAAAPRGKVKAELYRKILPDDLSQGRLFFYMEPTDFNANRSARVPGGQVSL